MRAAVWVGIIPAGAGKSGDACHAGAGRRDHPRGCGEKAILPEAGGDTAGSSPRVRGKGRAGASPPAPAGIIPAGAGKRPCIVASSRPSRDHPRGCGEKLTVFGVLGGGGDHPRGCGEKGTRGALEGVRGGSSPRVRGKVTSNLLGRRCLGIIPAGAGKSFNLLIVGSWDEDHPRGCGEKGQSGSAAGGSQGSSPRVRGKDTANRLQVKEERIIPAGAGKRLHPRQRPEASADHPRGCGEKGQNNNFTCSHLGSSPRVRGKGSSPIQLLLNSGIIPAGAGKSQSSSS